MKTIRASWLLLILSVTIIAGCSPEFMQAINSATQESSNEWNDRYGGSPVTDKGWRTASSCDQCKPPYGECRPTCRNGERQFVCLSENDPLPPTINCPPKETETSVTDQTGKRSQVRAGSGTNSEQNPETKTAQPGRQPSDPQKLRGLRPANTTTEYREPISFPAAVIASAEYAARQATLDCTGFSNPPYSARIVLNNPQGTISELVISREHLRDEETYSCVDAIFFSTWKPVDMTNAPSNASTLSVRVDISGGAIQGFVIE